VPFQFILASSKWPWVTDLSPAFFLAAILSKFSWILFASASFHTFIEVLNLCCSFQLNSLSQSFGLLLLLQTFFDIGQFLETASDSCSKESFPFFLASYPFLFFKVFYRKKKIFSQPKPCFVKLLLHFKLLSSWTASFNSFSFSCFTTPICFLPPQKLLPFYASGTTESGILRYFKTRILILNISIPDPIFH